MTTRPAPPALGTDARTIWRAWEQLDQHYRRWSTDQQVVGLVPGEGLFGFHTGLVVRLYPATMQEPVPTYTVCDQADLQLLDRAVARGWLQIEIREMIGVYVLRERPHGDRYPRTLRVVHQATGRPVPAAPDAD